MKNKTKKSVWFMVALFFGMLMTAIWTVTPYRNVYVADICILFICCLTFQLGISTEKMATEKQNTKAKAEETKNIKNNKLDNYLAKISGYLFAIAMVYAIGFVYKIAVFDLLKDGWMKYGATIAFFIGSWIVPYMTGYITRKHWPWLKNNLSLT